MLSSLIYILWILRKSCS